MTVKVIVVLKIKIVEKNNHLALYMLIDGLF